jgi:hypothetical protein
MNPKLPPEQLAEEREKRKAMKPAYEAWCRRRGFPLPSEHRQTLNDATKQT